MPAKVSYPGVYIEEIPNGNHAITGVATSITAFVGRARRGPIDSCHESPARIGSFAEYERVFGGLWIESPMSFAVYHFFLNGGSDALIVRVHNSAVAGTASVALADGGTTTFSAANPGMWATRLRMRIDTNINAAVQRANPADTMFNLRVKDLETGITEMHDNLSITQGHPRFVGDVLTQCSMMLRGPATTLSGLPTVNATTSAVDPFDDASATSVAMNADDGTAIEASHIADPRLRDAHRGMFALERAGMFNLLCIPPFAPATDVDKTTWDASVAYATERRALVLVDPPFNTAGWKQPSDVIAAAAITNVAERSANAALFFPRVRVANPFTQNRVEPFAPSALVAGVIARTDALRGVWASPSGTTATLNGVLDLDVSVTDRDNSAINQLGVNCLRHFPQSGPVVWGARTLKGADSLASEWSSSRTKSRSGHRFDSLSTCLCRTCFVRAPSKAALRVRRTS